MGDEFKNISNSKIVNRSKTGSHSSFENEEAWFKKPKGIFTISLLATLVGAYLVFVFGW